MSLRDKINRELNIQAEIQGEEAVSQCRIALKYCRSLLDWRAVTDCTNHRYGVLSYETHRFYSVKPWVVEMCRELEGR
jgi:hypothetical protein